jgi:hypothetical protein
MKPLWKQQVNLANVLFQRRVTGRIILDIGRGTQAFSRVQGDLGRTLGGAAMRGPLRLLCTLYRKRFELDRAAVKLLCRKQQLGQRRHPQQADHKQHPDHHANQRDDVEDAPQPLPALALRIEENLLVHISLDTNL